MIVLIIAFGSLFAQQDEILELKEKIIQLQNKFHYTTKKPVMDLFAQNSIDLKGKLETGKYKFRAVLKDNLSEKTAAKTIEFEIR